MSPLEIQVTAIETPNKSFMVLANEDEDFATSGGWNVEGTGRRVEFVFVCCLSGSAIIGTVLWGYA